MSTKDKEATPAATTTTTVASRNSGQWFTDCRINKAGIRPKRDSQYSNNANSGTEVGGSPIDLIFPDEE